MGNASSHSYTGTAPPPAADARVILQHDLPKVIYVEQLANGKFIKSYKCRVDGITVVVKVYIKRDPTEDLEPIEACLSKMALALDPRSCPNVLPYQRWLRSNVRTSQHRGAGTPAYLLRQHLLSTLSDRLSTRPFLSDIEKRWLVYLLLRAAAQCHSKGVCHGDIKSENVLVTSGNWLLLTDFAPFKPTFLPDDHPADANYYFSLGEKGRCYLAPERFYSVQQASERASVAAGRAKFKAGAGANEGTSAAPGSVAVGSGGALERLEASEIRPLPGSGSSTSSPPTAHPQSEKGSTVPRAGLGKGEDECGSEDASHVHELQQAQGGGAKEDSKRSPGSLGGDKAGINGASGGRGGRDDPIGGGLLESMDVFSLGCVIAEIFLGGDALLDLPGLLRYRISGDMRVRLKKLEAAGGPVILRLVEHMLQRDAAQRKTVQEYIRRMEKPGMLFPKSFGSFLFPLLATMHAGGGSEGDTKESSDSKKGERERHTRKGNGETETRGSRSSAKDSRLGTGRAVRSPDERLALVARSYGRAMSELAGCPDPEGDALLQEALAGFGDREGKEAPAATRKGTGLRDKSATGNCPHEGGEGGEGQDDLAALIEKTRFLISRVEALAAATSAVGVKSVPPSSSVSSVSRNETLGATGDNDSAETLSLRKEQSVDANRSNDSGSSVGAEGSHGGVAGGGRGTGGGQGLVILVQVVCSCLRHLRYPRSRLLALNLLVAFGRCCDDETRLQRLVPYTMTMLDDPVPVVRATAVRSLRALLGIVTSFPPSDSNMFSLYIFPALQRLPSDSSDLVRIAFAESLASLAETSRRFLETAYAMRRAAIASASTSSSTSAAAPSVTMKTATASNNGNVPAVQSNQQSEDPGIAGSTPDKTPGDGKEGPLSPEIGRGEVGGRPTIKDIGGGTGVGGGCGGGDSDSGANSPTAGVALLEGSYDKELSSIRAQISRWFVVLASSGGASGGGGGGRGGGGPMGSGLGDWSGASGGSGGGSGDGIGDGGASASAVVVKRALLADITRLCVFFGFENTLDSILPQLITFLNDRDWSLRAAFCDHIPAVCALAGEVATTRFILPCIENTLVDAREAVVARGLRCLASLAGLGLLPRYALPGQAKAAAPLLQHPGLAVRSCAVELCVKAAEALGPLDTQVFLHPLLQPHLRYALSGSPLDEITLLEALKPPLSRAVFDAAVARVCEARRTRGRSGGAAGGASEDGHVASSQLAPTREDARQTGETPSLSSGVGGTTPTTRTLSVSPGRADETRFSGSEPGSPSLPPRYQRHQGVAAAPGTAAGVSGLRREEDNEEGVTVDGRQQSAHHSLLAVDRRPLGMSGGDSCRVSPEEKEALVSLKGYIDTAAQHAANKMAGRSNSVGSGGGRFFMGDLRNGTRWGINLPESLSQAIYVPTQKITTLHPGAAANVLAAAASAGSMVMTEKEGEAEAGAQVGKEIEQGEDSVDVRLSSPALDAYPGLLQNITGMHTNLLDARRAMALVDQTESDATEYGYASFAAAYGYGYGYSPPYPSSVTSAASMTPVAPGGGIPGSRGSGGDRGSGGWEASPRGMGRDVGGGGSLGKGGSLSWAAVDSATLLLRRAKALGVPPLPPNLGAVRTPNGAKYSHYLLQPGGGSSSTPGVAGHVSIGASTSSSSAGSSAASAAVGAGATVQHQYDHGGGGSLGGAGGGGSMHGSTSRRPDWRPRQGVLVASLKEHGGPVNRLALSQDQAFFVSASSDGTCKVWELRGMDHTVSPQSRATYSRQGGRILDSCMVDNSHSVASASSDGTVHVWRVELAGSTSALPYSGYASNSHSGAGGAGGSGAGSMGGRNLSPTRLPSQQYGGSPPMGSNGGPGTGRRRFSGSSHSGVDPAIPPLGSGYAVGSASAGGAGIGSGVGGGGSGNVGGGGSGGGSGNPRTRAGAGNSLRVCGSSMVRSVSGDDGEVVSVHHFNTELGSPLVYGTRKGVIRSWDLRTREEPWALRAHPELGFLSSVALGTEKTWLVAGSSRGFVMLWDLRFQVLARLWRHSSGGPVHKLATCSRLPPPDSSPGPHVIVAAGKNEAAVWDLPNGGACKQCFRVLPPWEGSGRSTRGRNQLLNVVPGPELPSLEEIPLPSHPNASALPIGSQLAAVRDFSSGSAQAGGDLAIRALVGRISRSERDSYLITGGTDRCIRYWDFQVASRCYVVSGREPSLGRPSARTLQVPGPSPGARPSNVVLYYDEEPPPPNAPSFRSDSPPMGQEKGLTAPRSSHDDAVLDVKVTELPMKMLLSGSRDGAVKIWR